MTWPDLFLSVSHTWPAKPGLAAVYRLQVADNVLDSLFMKIVYSKIKKGRLKSFFK
jgi:hypothetical protein